MRVHPGRKKPFERRPFGYRKYALRRRQSIVPEPPSPQPDPPPLDTKSGISSMKDGLEVTGKILLGVTGLCYLLGLLIVPLDVHRYGISALDLSHLRYAAAGTWAVLPIVLILISLIFIVTMIKTYFDDNRKQKHWINKWADLVAIIVGTIGVVLWIFSFLFQHAGIHFNWKSWWWIPWLGTFAALITLAAVYTLGKITRQHPLSDLVTSLGGLVVGATALVIYVVLFSNNTYHTIPWAAGGGNPSRVRLFIGSEAMPYVQSVGIQIAENKTAAGIIETEPVQLIVASDKQLVIINSSDQAVGLPTDVVKWLKYEK